MNTKHAVLTVDSLWYRIQGAWMQEKIKPATLTDIADMATERYISHVWVLPECGDFERQKSAGLYSIQINDRHKKMVGASIWKRGKGHVNINFAANSVWWGTVSEPRWMQRAAFRPVEILVTIRHLEVALGVPFGVSAGGDGWEYLKKLHASWIEEIPGVDLKECHFTSKAAPDIIWQIEDIAALVANALYVHKLDKGSAYPGAAAQTDIGTGTPEYVAHGRHTTELDKIGNFRKVGVWHCFVAPTDKVDYSMPPAAIKEGYYWIAGPRINMLRAAGYFVEAAEGYVFPSQHDVLALWANNLWNIRQDFNKVDNVCTKYAAEAIKLIANATIGFTAYKGFEDENEEKRRPDIRVQVIAKHTEIMRANIAKVKALYGSPIMVYMDAVYYLSDNPDGRAAFAELLKREGKLGGFRYEGRIAVTDEVRAMFERKINVASRLEFMNKIGWVE